MLKYIRGTQRTSKKKEIPIILSQPNSALINKYQQNDLKLTSSSINELPKVNASKQDSSEDDIGIETYTSDQMIVYQNIPAKDIDSTPRTSSKNQIARKKQTVRKSKQFVRAKSLLLSSKIAQKTNNQKTLQINLEQRIAVPKQCR